MTLTDEDRQKIRAYLDACERSRDFQRFAHLAWAGPGVTQHDVERWIRHLVRLPWLVHVDASLSSKHKASAGLVFHDQQSQRLWIEISRFEAGDSNRAELRAVEQAIELLGDRPAIIVTDNTWALRNCSPPAHIGVRLLEGASHPDHHLAHKLARWAGKGCHYDRPVGRLQIEGFFTTLNGKDPL